MSKIDTREREVMNPGNPVEVEQLLADLNALNTTAYRSLATHVETHPQALSLLRHLRGKQARIIKLITFCLRHPKLDMVAMVADYSKSLDEVAQATAGAPEPIDIVPLSGRQKTAREQRAHSRNHIIRAAAVRLYADGPLKWSYNGVQRECELSKNTVYSHFPNRAFLAVALYEHLSNSLEASYDPPS